MSDPVSSPTGSAGTDLVADLVRRTELVQAASTEAVAGLDREGGDDLTKALVEQLYAVHAECERIHGILGRVASMMGTSPEAVAAAAAPAPAVAATPEAAAAEPTPAAAPFAAAPTGEPVTATAPIDEVAAETVGPDAMPPPVGAPVLPQQPALQAEPAPASEAIGPPPDAPIAVPSDSFATSGSLTSYPGTGVETPPAAAPTPAPANETVAATGTAGTVEPSEGVRLLATQMAVAGESAGDIERRLREDFGVSDSAAIVRELFGHA